MTTQTLIYCGSIGAEGKKKAKKRTTTHREKQDCDCSLAMKLNTQADSVHYIPLSLVPLLDPV